MTRRTALMLVLAAPMGKSMQETEHTKTSGSIRVLLPDYSRWGISFPETMKIFTVTIGGKSFEFPVEEIVAALEEKQ